MWCSFTPSPPPPLHKTTLVLDFVCLCLFCYSFPSLCKYESLQVSFSLISFSFQFCNPHFRFCYSFFHSILNHLLLLKLKHSPPFNRLLLICFVLSVLPFSFRAFSSLTFFLDTPSSPFLFFLTSPLSFYSISVFLLFFLSQFFLPPFLTYTFLWFFFLSVFCLVICEWIPLLTFNPVPPEVSILILAVPIVIGTGLPGSFFYLIIKFVCSKKMPSLKCKCMKSWKSKLKRFLPIGWANGSILILNKQVTCLDNIFYNKAMLILLKNYPCCMGL